MEIMKFNYLRSLLDGDAAVIISGLALTSENYGEAVKLLRSRYGNKQVLISAHMDKLLNLSPVSFCNDVKRLRELYDVIERSEKFRHHHFALRTDFDFYCDE